MPAARGAVSHAEHLGSDTMLYVDCPGLGLINARVAGDYVVDVGSTVTLRPLDARIFRFDGEGRTIAA